MAHNRRLPAQKADNRPSDRERLTQQVKTLTARLAQQDRALASAADDTRAARLVAHGMFDRAKTIDVQVSDWREKTAKTSGGLKDAQRALLQALNLCMNAVTRDMDASEQVQQLAAEFDIPPESAVERLIELRVVELEADRQVLAEQVRQLRAENARLVDRSVRLAKVEEDGMPPPWLCRIGRSIVAKRAELPKNLPAGTAPLVDVVYQLGKRLAGWAAMRDDVAAGAELATDQQLPAPPDFTRPVRVALAGSIAERAQDMPNVLSQVVVAGLAIVNEAMDAHARAPVVTDDGHLWCMCCSEAVDQQGEMILFDGMDTRQLLQQGVLSDGFHQGAEHLLGHPKAVVVVEPGDEMPDGCRLDVRSCWVLVEPTRTERALALLDALAQVQQIQQDGDLVVPEPPADLAVNHVALVQDGPNPDCHLAPAPLSSTAHELLGLFCADGPYTIGQIEHWMCYTGKQGSPEAAAAAAGELIARGYAGQQDDGYCATSEGRAAFVPSPDPNDVL